MFLGYLLYTLAARLGLCRDSLTCHVLVCAGVLIANKTDLRENNRDAITTKDAEDFSERNDFKYFETSAVRRRLSGGDCSASLVVLARLGLADPESHRLRTLLMLGVLTVWATGLLLQQQNTGIEAPFVYIAEWFYKKYQNAAQRA